NFPDFLTVPVCALVSVGITAFAAVIIRRYFPQINDSMGTYIYLLAAYPVAAAVFHHKNAKNLGTALAWALRNILYFSCGTIIIGIIRDFLAYNRLIGIPLPATFKLEAAKMPFFGFIALAFLLAAATRIHMAVKLRLAVEETPQTEMPQNAAQEIPQDAPQDNL
ncbi:MAG: Rnf-Nqr domain containing protein, partial [Angelakisella sp.]